MALHDPLSNIKFLDENGYVSKPWQEWLFISKRDKANRVEGGTQNHIATLDADGHPQDGAKSLPSGDLADLTSIQQFSNKSFNGLGLEKILASTVLGGIKEIDLDDFVSAGTSSGLTITDNGDGTISIIIKLKSSYGIDVDSDGLKLKQQANEADASESHSITDPGDSPVDADALRDDLVANTIPDIEAALDALGVKINAILDILLGSEIMAAP